MRYLVQPRCTGFHVTILKKSLSNTVYRVRFWQTKQIATLNVRCLKADLYAKLHKLCPNKSDHIADFLITCNDVYRIKHVAYHLGETTLFFTNRMNIACGDTNNYAWKRWSLSRLALSSQRNLICVELPHKKIQTHEIGLNLAYKHIYAQINVNTGSEPRVFLEFIFLTHLYVSFALHYRWPKYWRTTSEFDRKQLCH